MKHKEIYLVLIAAFIIGSVKRFMEVGFGKEQIELTIVGVFILLMPLLFYHRRKTKQKKKAKDEKQ